MNKRFNKSAVDDELKYENSKKILFTATYINHEMNRNYKQIINYDIVNFINFFVLLG